MAVKRAKKIDKLSLTSVMDAVFIFIFFLLMSAQFVEIYEINVDAPAVSVLKEETDKKEPLSLILHIEKNNILITTGVDEIEAGNVQKSGLQYDFKALTKLLTQIKSKNIEENSVIFKPAKDIPYKDIISVIDAIKETEGKQEIAGKNVKGDVIRTVILFDQIIFETQT